MLRISVERSETAMTIRLEGRVAGPEVKELAKCWLAAVAADPHESIVVDLEEVTSIDAAGKELLASMYRRGAKLLGAGLMTRAIAEKIERENKGRSIPER